jgi:two-component system, NtrC family, nitrogen regulation sensor histidine kinase NtrY
VVPCSPGATPSIFPPEGTFAQPTPSFPSPSHPLSPGAVPLRPFTSPVLILVAALLTAGWVASGWVFWLALSAVALGASLVPWMRPEARTDVRPGTGPGARTGPAVVGMVLAVTAGFAAEGHLARVSGDWDRRLARWEADTEGRLANALDQILLANEQAADRLVTALQGREGALGPELPPGLRTPGVDALAVFGPAGQLRAWEGSHQGPVPREVRLGLSPYVYEEGALFGYLYVSRTLPGGEGTVVAASLLRADLPASLEDVRADFVSRFQQETGARIQLSRADRVEGESVWDLRWEEQVLFSVTLVPPTEAEVRMAMEGRWDRGVALLLLLVWLLLARDWRRIAGGPALLSGGLLLLLLVLPLGFLIPVPRLFSPADFLPPGPLTLTLGDLLLLAAASVFAAGLLVQGSRGSRGSSRGTGSSPQGIRPSLLRAGIATLGVVAFLGWAELGLSRDLLAGPERLWLTLVGGVGLMATVLLGVCLGGGGGGRSEGGGRLRGDPLAMRVGSVAVALGLGIASAYWVRATAGFPLWMAGLWGVPLAMMALGGFGDGRWRSGAIRWTALGALTFSLVLPWAWGGRVEARIAAAEERMERLGTEADPFLEFLLLRTGEQAEYLSTTGRNPVEVLYSAWTESGLAGEGVPVWLTWWSPEGVPQEELRIGVPATRPPVPVELLQRVRVRSEVVVERTDLAGAHYMAAAPLARGALLTAVVPPRRGLAAGSPLGPLFSPARVEPDPLVMIPLLPGETPEAHEGVRWVSTSEGWQGETFVVHPDQVYHGHYVLSLPGPFLLLARGTLVLLAALALVLLLWSGGRRLALGPGAGARNAMVALVSFRGRVTVALFIFFLAPTVLFGTLAYRTLAGASVRTAETLAARAVEDAAAWYFDVAEAMDLLASRVGSDLLLYEGGQLVGGSLRELTELGLYEGWLPPAIHRDMVRGEELMTTASATLGGYEYVVAYRRMPGGRVLAAPAPLQAGAAALRQREVADLLAFAVVLGAGLSVLLALLVGQTLARPIQTLQVASERVGAGNMGVHLPTDRLDEFGAVFGAFNRMVDRLARTRKALVRSSRRTRAIVEEVATGVIALDAQGRITLANPRAEALLGSRLTLNQPLPNPGGSDPETALARWVEGYMRDDLGEAGTELQFGDRRIRVRARRISRRGPPGGAVISLEDVTDELRTERVLAWGEMAQQVAHEVKNPLTPIKLGVQHIRRAWEDGREDYGEILSRNVEAILPEIDRLAAIASSFSRFAAPTPAGEKPLERVDVARVVDEVLALYAAAEGPVRFSAHLDGDLPPVRCRAAELKEVLVNLLENARAALPEGGRVQIEGEPRVEGVELRVRDDGAGVPPELVTRVFEPHFSTRTSGSGLGLAIVRRLVESWGGTVRLESREGEGTLVRMALPGWRSGGDAPVGGG